MYGIKAYIKSYPLEISLNKISNDMQKSKNGLLGQKL